MKTQLIAAIVASSVLVSGIAYKSVMDEKIEIAVDDFNEKKNLDFSYDSGFYNILTDTLSLSGVSDDKLKLRVDSVSLSNVSDFEGGNISASFTGLELPIKKIIKNERQKLIRDVISNSAKDGVLLANGRVDISATTGNGLDIITKLGVDNLAVIDLNLILKNFPIEPTLKNFEKISKSRRLTRQVLMDVTFKGTLDITTQGLPHSIREAGKIIADDKGKDFDQEMKKIKSKINKRGGIPNMPWATEVLLNSFAAVEDDKNINIKFTKEDESTFMELMQRFSMGKKNLGFDLSSTLL
jgi:hypothetical protein